MNGGRVAKRLLAVVLALSTLVTLGFYYNGLSSGVGVGGGGRADDRPQPAALLPAIEWPKRREDDSSANDVAPSEHRKRPGVALQHRVAPMTATVNRDTCPVLGLANTTIDTAAEFSRFEFQVRPISNRFWEEVVFGDIVLERFVDDINYLGTFRIYFLNTLALPPAPSR